MNQKPLLVIFAGPNGSGKSSVIKKLHTQGISLPDLYINADVYKAENHCSNLEAAQKSDEMRKIALEERKSFITETVMSTLNKINLM